MGLRSSDILEALSLNMFYFTFGSCFQHGVVALVEGGRESFVLWFFLLPQFKMSTFILIIQCPKMPCVNHAGFEGNVTVYTMFCLGLYCEFTLNSHHISAVRLFC